MSFTSEDLNKMNRKQIDLLPLGVVKLSGQGEIVLCNRLLSERLGKTEEELVGKNLFNDLLSSGAENARSVFEEVLGKKLPHKLVVCEMAASSGPVGATFAMMRNKDEDSIWATVHLS